MLSITLVCCLVSCTINVKTEPDFTINENTEPSLPTPGNGYVFEGITADYESSTLTITTVAPVGHYFILDPIRLYCSPFADSFEQNRAELHAKYGYIKFYANGESTVEIEIPWGEYKIYYATGENWYGEEELFGNDTIYSKCYRTFTFTNSTEFTLRIPNANLSIEKIDANEFPN